MKGSDFVCCFDFYCCSCQAVQNLGLALITMVTGLIVDHYGFLMLEIFFIVWLAGEEMDE